MVTASSIVETRSFRRYDCGKTRITMAFPSLRNCTPCRSSGWIQFRWITRNRDGRISTAMFSAIARKSTMRAIRTSVVGPGTSSWSARPNNARRRRCLSAQAGRGRSSFSNDRQTFKRSREDLGRECEISTAEEKKIRIAVAFFTSRGHESNF